MPDSSGAVDLGQVTPPTEEPQEEERQSTDGEERKQPVLLTFGVIVGLDGNPSVVAFEHPSVQAVLQPTNDLLFMAASTLVKDLQAGETAHSAAEMTVGLMQQQARAMQEQFAQAQVAEQLRASGMGRV